MEDEGKKKSLNTLDKHDLVRIFNETGILLELKGENQFKIRAYFNAARALENFSEDLGVLIREERLREIHGFGDAITKKIVEWNRTGTIEYFENLKSGTPAGLLEMLRIPGLGPKKINVIYRKFGIMDLEMLEAACLENKLVSLPGFGAKTQEKIRAGIRFVKEHRGQFLLYEVHPTGILLRDELLKHPSVLRAELAGSARRLKEVVKDLDLVAGADDPELVIKYFVNLPQVAQALTEGGTKGSVLLKTGINVDLRVVKPEEYPHALQHFTGSKEHNTALRHLAKGLGYKVNEYGLFREDEPVYCRSEAELYQRLGLEYIPPELREDLGELEAAKKGILPKLVDTRDLKGLFHIHTTYSDGVNNLREMVEAAIKRGYTYLGISDHSQAAVYAHGLNKEVLFRQFEEIDQLNQEYPDFKIFKGIEVDILSSGDLDYSSDTLVIFDFVIGSVHSQFRMSREAMTERILKAMNNPYLTMLGHPTGRILLERPDYEVDLEAIIEKAAQNQVILEFNANPYRFDLDWRWCRKAKERGVRIAINPDAHGEGELDLVAGGLAVARKGWLETADVFNTKSVEEVERFFAGRKLGKS